MKIDKFSVKVYPDPKLSKNGFRSTHWRILQPLIKQAREDGYMLALEALPRNFEQMPYAHVHIKQLYSRTPKDFDGLAVSVAGYIDGLLIDSGVLADDSPFFIRSYTLTHQKVPKVSDECVIITVSRGLEC